MSNGYTFPELPKEVPPLAYLGVALMALGHLGPAGSARTREAALRASIDALSGALQFKALQQRLALQRKALEHEEQELALRREALQLEFTKARLAYEAMLALGQQPETAPPEQIIETLPSPSSAPLPPSGETSGLPLLDEPSLFPKEQSSVLRTFKNLISSAFSAVMESFMPAFDPRRFPSLLNQEGQR